MEMEEFQFRFKSNTITRSASSTFIAFMPTSCSSACFTSAPALSLLHPALASIICGCLLFQRYGKHRGELILQAFAWNRTENSEILSLIKRSCTLLNDMFVFVHRTGMFECS